MPTDEVLVLSAARAALMQAIRVVILIVTGLTLVGYSLHIVKYFNGAAYTQVSEKLKYDRLVKTMADYIPVYKKLEQLRQCIKRSEAPPKQFLLYVKECRSTNDSLFSKNEPIRNALDSTTSSALQQNRESSNGVKEVQRQIKQKFKLLDTEISALRGEIEGIRNSQAAQQATLLQVTALLDVINSKCDSLA